MVVFVGLVLVALAAATRWHRRRDRDVSRVSGAAIAPLDESAVLVGPVVPLQRPFEQARTDHLASLKARVAYFAGGNTRVRCELDQSSGLWRTWCDAPSYEKAALRATWRTESGAWRLLLRALTGNEFGGVWMAVTK